MISREQLLHDFTFHVRQSERTSLELVDQSGVVESEQVEDGGLKVVDVNAILNDLVAELVGFADGDAWLDAASGEQDGEGVRVVIATEEGRAAALRSLACGRTRRPRSPRYRREGRVV